MNPGAVIFRRYELHEQIGAGGAGTVWKATDQLLHQTVALKRVTVTGLDPKEARLTRDRALREARLAAQLRGHPHVVAVYDALIDAADIWLVMEYLPARSLRELLEDAHSPLEHAEVARIGAAIADALAAAHDRRIEHRDVKPGNVLIGHDGTVKLTDFGISHLTGDPHLTQSGITGTPAYLAPEVAGNGESSPASDIFSLGATLYAALEGQPPFGTDDNLLQLLKIVRTGIIRPPRTQAPSNRSSCDCSTSIPPPGPTPPPPVTCSPDSAPPRPPANPPGPHHGDHNGHHTGYHDGHHVDAWHSPQASCSPAPRSPSPRRSC